MRGKTVDARDKRTGRSAKSRAAGVADDNGGAASFIRKAAKNCKSALLFVSDFAGEMGEGWKGSKELFNHKKVDRTYDRMLPKASLSIGLALFLAACLISSFIVLVSIISQAYFSAFTNDSAGMDGKDAQAQHAVMARFNESIGQIIESVPISLFLCVLGEGVVFCLARFSGGRGAISGQFYLSSVAALGRAVASALAVLAVVPIFGWIAALASVILLLYFILLVTPKAYVSAHRIGFYHALALSVIASLVTIGLLMLIVYSLPNLVIAQQASCSTGNGLGIGILGTSGG